MAFASLALISLLFNQCHSGKGGKWGYDDRDANTSHWMKYWEECGGSRQSGIDVIFDETCTCLQALDLTNNWVSENLHFVLGNNGHSLKAIPFAIDHDGGAEISELQILDHTNDTSVGLNNLFYNTYKSPIHKAYCFDSLHFHWGVNDGTGSEHKLNGKQYPLELHLVHYSCDYDSIGDALHHYLDGSYLEKYDDGNVLAVIAILFEIGEPNETLQTLLNEVITHNIHKFHDPEDPTYIDNILQLYYTEFNMMDH